MIDKFRVTQVLSSKKVIESTDLLGVRMSDGSYTIFKNRYNIKFGEVIDSNRFNELKETAEQPIILNERYILTNEEGKVLYD